MQPTLFSNVRTNLSHLPRSISPHLASPASPSSSSSSIRSLSPSRHSPHLRSRSSSPSPRRFASVLAYHATPPPDGYGKRKTTPTDEQQQQQQQQQQPTQQQQHGQLDGEDFEPSLREPLRRSASSRSNRDRDESPGRIAFRNLEESWKRFELESSTSAASSPSLGSSPLLGSSNSANGSPSSRPASPSPLSRPLYRELIECASLRNSAAVKDDETVKDVAVPNERTSSSTGISTPITKSTHSGGEKPSSGPKTLSRPSSSSSSSSSSLTGVATPGEIARTADEYFQQAGPPQGYKSTFLASDEARHILDLPSLLGKDPNMIPAVLAVPIPLQPTRPSKGRSSSVPSSTAAGSTAGPSSDQEADTQASKAVSDLDAKARSTAKAMTKRYAAKNLNMTETEAHRMVQLMAAEIVALHEERQAMVRKMEQAKQEMLEAARLLRMKAAGGPQTGTMGEKPQDMSDEEEGRQGLDAGLYDKDEWRR